MDGKPDIGQYQLGCTLGNPLVSPPTAMLSHQVVPLTPTNWIDLTQMRQQIFSGMPQMLHQTRETPPYIKYQAPSQIVWQILLLE
jgi:hypothetical protein